MRVPARRHSWPSTPLACASRMSVQGFGDEGLGVSGFGFRVSAFGFREKGLGIKGPKIWVLDLGLRGSVSGSRFFTVSDCVTKGQPYLVCASSTITRNRTAVSGFNIHVSNSRFRGPSTVSDRVVGKAGCRSETVNRPLNTQPSTINHQPSTHLPWRGHLLFSLSE